MAKFPSLRLRAFLAAYGLLWTLGLPFALAYLWRRARRDPAYTTHLAERFGRHTAMPGAVWVHAVSLGEVRSAVPLIRALLGQGERIVITHFTPAGRRESTRVFAAEIAAGRVAAVWVPFELSLCYNAFFRAFTPKYGLVMEVEIWPRMIMAARAAGIPLLPCNAQYPARSFARDGQTGVRAEVMRGFAGALVKSPLQAERFAAVGVPNIEITGELRFDQPIPPALLQAAAALGLTRTAIAFASVVEGEDDGYISIIKSLHDEAKKSGEGPPLILYIPRAPERFDATARMLEDAGLRVARRSEILDANLGVRGPLPEMDVLLGDSLGEMYFYLCLATRVVVGGGFTPRGAHNIIEPLALKKPVLTGPVTWPIEFPFEEAKAAGVARSLADPDALARALITPQDPTPAQIEAFFNAHSGATGRTLDAIKRITSR